MPPICYLFDEENSMDFLVQQLINALMTSAIYAYIASGFTLYFGVLNVLNIAHGETVMIGVFITMTLNSLAAALGLYQVLTPMPTIILVLVVSVGLTGFIGVLIQVSCIKPLRDAPTLVVLLVTVGLAIAIPEVVRFIYPQGSNPQVFPKIISTRGFQWGEIFFRYDNMVIIFVGLVLFVFLYIFLTRTKVGIQIRAMAQEREAALMMGVNLNFLYSFTFFLASVLGATAGIMYGIYYDIVRYDIGFMNGLKGFSASVVGGLGNVYGAVIGGLIFGFAETFAVAFIPGGSAFREVITFIVVVIFLIFRPSGILGHKIYEKV